MFLLKCFHYFSNAENHCSSFNETLSYSKLNGTECQQGLGQWRQNWRKMICRNESDTYIDWDCCKSWCEQLASCFRQSSSWTSRCKEMWRCKQTRKIPRKKLSIIMTNTTDSSYLGSIKVKYCWKTKFSAIKLISAIEVSAFDTCVTVPNVY